MKKILLLLLLLPCGLYAQQKTYKVQRMLIEDGWTVDPARFKTDYHVSVSNLEAGEEAPFPGGEAARNILHRRKMETEQRFPRTSLPGSFNKGVRDGGDSLTQLDNFAVRFFLTDFPMLGGTPNDNTLAISNDGMLLTSYNT